MKITSKLMASGKRPVRVYVASFPDSTPKLFIAPAFIHGAIKSLGVESGNEAMCTYVHEIRWTSTKSGKILLDTYVHVDRILNRSVSHVPVAGPSTTHMNTNTILQICTRAH